MADELPILLSASWCPVCAAAKEYLESQGETYQTLDIDISSEGKALFKKSGAKGPPVLIVDGNYYSGFDPIAWKQALQRSQPSLMKRRPTEYTLSSFSH